MWRSVRQTPQARTRSRSCPAAGSGLGTSASRSGSPGASSTIALIGSSLRAYDCTRRHRSAALLTDALWNRGADLPTIPVVTSRTRESGFLREIISTVASSLDLDEVLRAVVRLLSDASAVHACFVYLVDEPATGSSWPRRAPPYDGLVGAIALERGEGLAWWAAERKEPAFIRENLLDDPRVKYVPELEEERFQSLVAVPILARAGDVIGVILAHTEAPREFTEEEVEFLVSSASLVAGAIENARLYEEMQRRVGELEHLTELAEVDRASRRRSRSCCPPSARSARSLLAAAAATSTCSTRGSRSCGCAPRIRCARGRASGSGSPSSAPSCADAAAAHAVSVPLVAGDELLGLLVAEDTAEVELARAVANQTAVAIKKIQLIERLTEKNLIKDFFEELAQGGAASSSRDARPGSARPRPRATSSSSPSRPTTRSSARSRPWRPARCSTAASGRRARSCASPRAESSGSSSDIRQVHEAPADRCRGRVSRASAPGREPRGRVRGGAPGPARDDRRRRHARRHRLRGARPVQVPAADRARRRRARRDGRRGLAARRLRPPARGVAPRRRSRSSSAAAARSAPPPRRSTSTRTRCASGCAGSPSCPGSTCAQDDWLMVEIAVKMVKLRGALGAVGPTHRAS